MKEVTTGELILALSECQAKLRQSEESRRKLLAALETIRHAQTLEAIRGEGGDD